jgi:DNA-binding Xre family transcriptional regulator
MDTVRWRLKEFLAERDLTPYALTRAADLAPNTVYTIARGHNHQVKLETLAGILGGLRKLTGEEVGFDDVLEYRTGDVGEAPGPVVPEPAWMRLAGVLDDPEGRDDLSLDPDAHIDAAVVLEYEESVRGER